MRRPIIIATLLIAAGAALPAFATTAAPISASLRDAAVAPVETVQYRQQWIQPRGQRQRPRNSRSYRSGYGAYAAQPRRADRGSWGRCVSGFDRATRSAFPSWDQC
jgi:hypothetical protein